MNYSIDMQLICDKCETPVDFIFSSFDKVQKEIKPCTNCGHRVYRTEGGGVCRSRIELEQAKYE